MRNNKNDEGVWEANVDYLIVWEEMYHMVDGLNHYLAIEVRKHAPRNQRVSLYDGNSNIG